MTPSNKNVLVISPFLPISLGKSAYLPMLKRLSSSGWVVTVVTVDRESYADLVTNWSGIEIVNICPSRSIIWRSSQAVYKARSRSSPGRLAHNGQTRNKDIKLPGILAAWPDYTLLPVSAVLSFPDKYRHAASEVQEKIRLLHTENAFQAVISVYGPFTSHLIARRLSAEEHIPWIALIKDYYSKPRYLTTSIVDRVVNQLKANYEKTSLSQCDALLPVNDNMAEYFTRLLPHTKVKALRHCYDEEDFEADDLRGVVPEAKFKILWVGAADDTDADNLKVFFAALAELTQEGMIDSQHFTARFVGHGSALIDSYGRNYGCSELLEIVPQVPHDQAMKELKQATCLIYTQDYVGSRRRLPEYLASRKPILVYPLCSGTMSERVLRDYGAAVLVANKADMKAALLSWYQHFKAQGQLKFPVNDQLVRSFSASHRAEELNEVLEEVVGIRPSPAFREGKES